MKYPRKPIPPLGIVIFLGLTSSVGPANAGVFEQLANGTVAPIDEVATDTSFLRKAIASHSGEPVVARLSEAPVNDLEEARQRRSVIEDDVVADLMQPDQTGGKSLALLSLGTRLPEPRPLSLDLTPHQVRMRRLAINVGNRYADAPGVARAALDRETFVALFATMVQRESNFDPRAISPAGASGLGQLMPATARELGVCDVFSPRENLEGAASYLTSMLEQFGSPAMALAAYNAGPGAVIRHRGIPPYHETRQYVADIIHAAARSTRSMASVGAIDRRGIQTSASGVAPITFETSTKPIALSGDCALRSNTSLILARN
ncbi:lytic transglycosylase domain-containing protein [Agrobacterium larrymoorei]|nr:lytic transglycosylase domain-containing protein [Agrobacterium larrymoorei]